MTTKVKETVLLTDERLDALWMDKWGPDQRQLMAESKIPGAKDLFNPDDAVRRAARRRFLVFMAGGDEPTKWY